MDNKILNTIFKRHDELSHVVVFGDTEEERKMAYTKYVALRELITDIKDNAIPKTKKKKFRDAMEAHYASIANGIFYKRGLNFND